MKITKQQAKKIIREELVHEGHPRGEEDEKYMYALLDLEDELKNSIANALEKGLFPEDLDEAWLLAKEYIEDVGSLVGERFDPTAPPKKDLADFSEEYDVAEYDRGYQDGFDNYPVADNATPDYDAGYEDGKLDAGLPEIPYDEVRSEDWQE